MLDRDDYTWSDKGESGWRIGHGPSDVLVAEGSRSGTWLGRIILESLRNGESELRRKIAERNERVKQLRESL